MRFWIVLSLALATALSACQPSAGGEAGAAPGGYFTMDVQELHAQLQSKDFVFVNVHIPFEGDIAGTDLSIPYDEITQSQNLALLPAEKDAKIVLYCRSGRMSAIAAKDLAAQGYTNIWDVPGGMVEWAAAGFPLEQ
ncbi:MAG TPA: rhodanese-like domain-containing protein [Anaerolineales bacterium]|nr:rhodanese-like domain-containing protein [Anaerolineales bacterium]